MARTVVLDEYGNYINQLTQWDLNRTLVLDDFEYDTNPVFHFCNRSSTEALVVESNLNDKKVIAKIPNELLESANIILVYICLCDSEKNIVDTIDYFELPVRKRPKPKDYVYVQNTEYIRISDLKNQLEEFLENSKQSLEIIENDFDNKKTEINTAIKNANEATTNANNASQSANKSKEAIETALNNGDFNGADGVSITDAKVIGNDLIVSLSDGNEINAGRVRDSAKKYGACYDMNTKNPKLTRLGDAKYLKAGIANGINDTNVVNDFDKIYPWCDIKRCTMANDGTITSYEGEPNYTEDGSIGQVMTKIPEHYQMKYVSEETGKMYWYASSEKLNEYYTYVPELYVGSFMMTTNDDGLGESRSGNAYYEKYNISDGRTYAMARGNRWHIFDIWEYEILKTLFIIEFATLDSQSILVGNNITSGVYFTVYSDILYFSTADDPATNNIIGNAFYSQSSDLFAVGDEIMLEVANNETSENLDYDGYAIRKIINVENMGNVVWEEDSQYYKYSFSGSPVEMFQEPRVGYNAARNGIANQIPASTGQMMSFDVSTSNVWRSIENFIGECNTFIDGILVYGNKYWVCKDINKYSNTIYKYDENGETTEDYQYTPISFTHPARGYISNLGYDETTGLTLPSDTEGSSSMGYCDEFSFIPRLVNSINTVLFGGKDDLPNGLFYYNCNRPTTLGSARLSYRCSDTNDNIDISIPPLDGNEVRY